MTLCSYKYRLFPTSEQEVLLNKHFGCVRFLYNHFLSLRIDAYKTEKKSVGYFETKRLIPNLKQEFPWLKEPGSQALQYSARALQNGYDNFFRKVKQKVKGKKGFPRFKKKHGKQSFKVMQNIRVIDGKLSIPKFKDGIPLIIHRPLEGEIEFATVSKNKAGQYFVSITTSRTIALLPEVEKTIGLDMNVHAIVGSDGKKYNNPLPKTKYKNRLRLLVKAAKRTEKESKGRKKAWLKLNQLEQHIHNIREDFQHKVSKKIIDENQVIVVETLCISDMLRNADPETRKIERWREQAYHRKMNDASFSSFIQKLKYKCEWYGRELRQVDKWYPSSQLCSVCGWQNKDLELTDGEWTCYNCFAMHDRDENAATNIHNEGISPRWNRGKAVCPDVRPVLNGLLVGTEAPSALAAG
jgi:putative transposase